MGPVYISVGHYYHPMITGFVYIKFLSDTGTNSSDKRTNFVIG